VTPYVRIVSFTPRSRCSPSKKKARSFVFIKGLELLLEHDLFRKPVPIGVEDMLFGIMLSATNNGSAA